VPTTHPWRLYATGGCNGPHHRQDPELRSMGKTFLVVLIALFIVGALILA
jgi:hypothetical protein